MSAKKKSKISYADEAKKIINRFKARLGKDFQNYDKMAVTAMNLQLSKLMEQQEQQKALKAQMEQPQMKYGGGLPQYGGLTEPTGWIPNQTSNPYPANQYSKEFLNRVNFPHLYDGTFKATGFQTGGEPVVTPQQQVISGKTGFKPVTTGLQPVNNQSTMDDRYGMGNYAVPGFPAAVQNYKAPMQPGMDQRYGKPNGIGFPAEVGNAAYTPEAQAKIQGANVSQQTQGRDNWFSSIPKEALIGMGSQALGTIAQGLLTKKPKDIKATPTSVPDYVPVQNEEAIRQAQLAYANQAAGSRYLSPSQYMAQMQALATGQAATTAGIAEQTANANAQGMNAYNMQKAGFDSDYRRQQLYADQYNNDNQIGYNAMQAGIPAALGQQVAGAMGDVMGLKNQEENRRWSGTDNYMSINYGGKSYKARVVDGDSGLSWFRAGNKTVYMQNGEEIDPKIYKAELDKVLARREAWSKTITSADKKN
jgi:hypothetical protein